MKQREDNTFVVFTNINENGDHSADCVIIQASGESFGTFDMKSIRGDAAYELFKVLKSVLRGQDV